MHPVGNGAISSPSTLLQREEVPFELKLLGYKKKFSFLLKRKKSRKERILVDCGSVTEKHKLITATVLLNIECLPRKDSVVSVITATMHSLKDISLLMAKKVALHPCL
jgi:hypothetical protein